MPYLDSLDIANKACQLLGAEQISSPTETSTKNKELTFAYDKLRRPELRRNVWRFAIRKAVLYAFEAGTMKLTPAQWVSTTTYLPGSIVADANNQWWVSTLDANLGNQPGGNTDSWEEFFGARTVNPYDTTGETAYFSGDMVYVPGFGTGSGPLAQGGYQVYMSLANQNSNVPNVPPLWNSTTTYTSAQFVTGSDTNVYQAVVSSTNQTPISNPNYWTLQTNPLNAWSSTTVYYDAQVVTYSGSQWISLIAYNLDNTPATGPANWSATTSYVINNTVTGPDNFQYKSLTSNTNVNPVTDGGTNWTAQNVVTAWQTTTAVPSNDDWVGISATLSNFLIIYPVGSGPSEETFSKNVFHLPYGYLRTAVQDPKAGSISILGAPTGDMYKDWAFERNFLVSQDPGPITFRFVADTMAVKDFDDMFSTGLAARLAMETCEKITQSSAKKQEATTLYAATMGEARRMNAIEEGADEPPVDDWISTRL